MTPRLRSGALLAGVLVLAAQLVQPRKVNPPVDAARDFWHDTNVDPRVHAVVRRACANCHSNETVWPWYSRISPVSWFLDKHIRDGRTKLNFSDWSGSDPDQMAEIYDSVAKRKMPMQSYLWMHPEANLSIPDRELLREWADGKLAKVRVVKRP